MALPTAYLTSTAKVQAVLNALRNAQAPPKFTQAFLEGLGFKSSSDRLYINVFKALGFLSPDGVPTDRYFRYLDQTQSGRVLAEGLQEAYGDLYQLNKDAHRADRAELKGKVKTLTEGQPSTSVIDKMVATFLALAKEADFSGTPAEGAKPAERPEPPTAEEEFATSTGAIRLGGLVYNIELHLPESRDPAVYDAFFRSLKTHLLS
jgi:hypothetical protein